MIDEILRSRSILITCGTGGVGKTTLSAALAMRAAMLGRRAVVVTIDPAKRLATSLGFEKLGNEAADLTPLLRKTCAAHSQECPGTLHAIVPDTRRTFEDFVNNLAPSQAVAEQVMRNPIFQIFAKEFSGTNEYMALERLFAISEQGHYDTIILDTPPSRNTLAFLDAPKLLAQFFDEKVIKWLVMPANKLVATGMRKAFGILEKLTGSGFMTHLFDFAAALFEVRVRFVANLTKITELLESRKVGFLVVAAPTPDTVPEVRHFIESIREHRFHFEGVALNRSLGYLGKADANGAPPDLKPGFEVLEALQAREELAVKALGEITRLHARLPELARDVHSVEDLYYVATAFGRDHRA